MTTVFGIPDLNEITAKILDKTQTILIEKGWCQRAFYTPEGAVCFSTALVRAGISSTTCYSLEHLTGTSSATFHSLGNLVMVEKLGSISVWNDKGSRTLEEVLEMCRVTSEELRNGEFDWNMVGVSSLLS